MATPVYVFYLPTVGGSTNTWGADLNSNWDKLDGILAGTEGNPLIKLQGTQIQNASINASDIGALNKRKADFTALECDSFDSNTGGFPFQATLGTTTANEFIGQLLGNATGNADSTTRLETPRNFSITGPINSGAGENFDGSADCGLTVSVDYDVLWPIGSVYMSTESTNPDQFFAGTTWELANSGQAPIGVGTHIDQNNDAKTFAVLDQGGLYRVSLYANQVPILDHQHHTFDGSSGIYSGNLPSNTGVMSYYRNFSGDQAYQMKRTTRATGPATATKGLSGSPVQYNAPLPQYPHANSMPYLAVYQWKRVS